MSLPSRLALLGTLLLSTPTMALDLAAMWDFKRPELSEQRFRQALAEARGDDALILQTQIARSYGLRQAFDQAREVLLGVAPGVAAAGHEAKARYHLELGRTYASATHPPELDTPDNQARARAAFGAALEAARAGQLDGLAIDAIHMFAFVDKSPADQLRWGQAALAVVEASSQPVARRWDASVRNNVGYALHQLGRYDEALTQFRQAVALRERGSDAEATRSAHWMVAWTLRAMQRGDEALAIQLRLEREGDAAGQPDRYVYEELAALYRARGDEARARRYAALHKATAK